MSSSSLAAAASQSLFLEVLSCLLHTWKLIRLLDDYTFCQKEYPALQINFSLSGMNEKLQQILPQECIGKGDQPHSSTAAGPSWIQPENTKFEYTITKKNSL